MKRQRLTITLRDDLLSHIDKKIDGVKIRNRSHAIEFLLAKSIGSKINKAFILAGGKGLKMRPFTYELPKSMITIKNRPILEYIIDILRNNGIKNIYIGIDYLGDKIKEYFSDGTKFGVNIHYIVDENPKGTAGALLSAKDELKDDNFLIINGDVLADIDLLDMIDFSEEQNSTLVMALTSVVDPSLYGSVRLRGAKIVNFDEKPINNAQVSRLVNAGIYVVTPKIFNYIQTKDKSLETDVFPRLIASKEASGYHFAGQWFDISTHENYERAIKEWQVLK